MPANALTSTRKTILHILKKNPGLTVNELGEKMSISSMGVRQHLQILENKGYVDRSKERGKVGRPSFIFHLTEKGEAIFPKQYDVLALGLLQLLEELESGQGELVERLFSLRKDKLREDYRERLEDLDLEGKVELLSKLQSRHGYMAEWEDEENAYTLTEFNCPISDVAEEYPQACKYESILFSEFLDAEVKRTEWIAEGGACCHYRIEKS